jgi:hypothetical protein
LTYELLVDQFPRNLQGSPRMMGKGLGAPKPGVRWPDWPSRGEDGTVTLKHDERCILIGQPAQRGQ